MLSRMRAAGQLGNTVVIHIGTNGEVSDETFAAIMANLPPEEVKSVWFLTVRADREWIAGNNSRIVGVAVEVPERASRFLGRLRAQHRRDGQRRHPLEDRQGQAAVRRADQGVGGHATGGLTDGALRLPPRMGGTCTLLSTHGIPGRPAPTGDVRPRRANRQVVGADPARRRRTVARLPVRHRRGSTRAGADGLARPAGPPAVVADERSRRGAADRSVDRDPCRAAPGHRRPRRANAPTTTTAGW